MNIIAEKIRGRERPRLFNGLSSSCQEADDGKDSNAEQRVLEETQYARAATTTTKFGIEIIVIFEWVIESPVRGIISTLHENASPFLWSDRIEVCIWVNKLRLFHCSINALKSQVKAGVYHAMICEIWQGGNCSAFRP